MRRITPIRRFLASLFLALGATGAAAAQEYPARPITLIVPFAAGGTSDIIARIAAEEMGQHLGQRFVVENIAGAGGATALTRAAAAAPDGYTITIGNAGVSAATYSIHKDLKFTPESFAPIGMVAKTLPVIALKRDFPANTLNEFLAYARANPGRITLGHAGTGSSNYLICKLFVQAAKVDVVLIGYRGAGPALNDAFGVHVDGVCDAATSVAAGINAGQVKGLVIASKKRAEILPDLPTATEAGLSAFTNEGWNALFAPAGTPAPVLAKLNEALRKAVASEKVTKRFAELASFPASGEEFNPEYVKAHVEAEVKRYRALLAE
jgi:tripartite-type tricarboxylate transporter receptor subunit TctC